MEPKPTERSPGTAALLLLIGVVLAALHPALRGGFLNFDDGLFFGPRAELADGGLARVLDPTRTIANAYLPVSHLSLWLDRALVGLGIGTWWPHLHSLLLHALAGFLFARLGARLGLAPRVAVGAALLFVLHPALVESAAWVSSRKDLLSGLFAFACLGAIARGAALPAVLTAAAAIYAKGTASALLLFVPLVLWLSGRRFDRGALATIGVLLLGSLHHAWIAAGEGTLATVDRGARLLALPGIWLHALRSLVWPDPLNVLHPPGPMLESATARLGPALALHAALLAAAIVALRRARWRLAGGAVLLLYAGLAPVNGVWPASSIAFADRYLYLVAPWGALALAALLPRAGWSVLLLGLLALPLGWRAQARSRDFVDSERLWTQSLAIERRNAVALLNLADAVAGEQTRARALALEASRVAERPEHRLRAHEIVRDLALAAGDVELAVLHARLAWEAAALLPPSRDARLAWRDAGVRAATILAADGESGAAADIAATLQRSLPEDPEVLVLLAELELPAAGSGTTALAPEQIARIERRLQAAFAGGTRSPRLEIVAARFEQARGNLLRAVAHCRRAREIDPRAVAAWLHEADILLAQALPQDAQQVVEQALAAGHRDPNLLVRLGLALAAQNRLTAARDRYEEYLTIRPDDAAVRRLLALVLLAQAEARLAQADPPVLQALLRRAQELDPGNAKAAGLEGRLAYRARELPRAIELLERAHAADPEDPDFRRDLAEAHRDLGNLLLLRDQEQSLRHLRRFLDLDAPGLPREASETTLRHGWRRIEARGIAEFQAKDLDAAERSFRLCLELVPEQKSALYQLGLVLYERGADLEQALRCFQQAEAWQRAQRQDPSLPVLYAVLTLGRLGRNEQARRRGEEFLAEGIAPEPMAVRIEDALRRLAR